MTGKESAMRAISDLGDTVARRWREQNHNEDVFPAIAADSLRESDLLAHHSGADLIDHGLQADQLPAQYFSGFGQPGVALYRGHEFHIEVLFWFDGTTSIHQHSFSGAFAVLEGGSVHTTYDFERHERVSSRVFLGDVQFRETEVFARGSVRTIEAGSRFIHALFHLDRPSVSLLIRTRFEPDRNPQFGYMRPGLALDPFYEPEPMMTQLRLLDAAREAQGIDGFIRACRTVLERADYWLAYRTLSLAYDKLDDQNAWHDLERTAKKRLGQRIEYLHPAFEELRRQKKIGASRKQIHDPDHRYLLALLLNVPHREGIERLIRARYGDVDARQLIVKWLKELSSRRQLGLDLDPLSLTVLECALNDSTVDDARISLRRSLPENEVDAQDSKLQQRWDEITGTQILRPLFASQ
jgi:hypothetical protein